MAKAASFNGYKSSVHTASFRDQLVLGMLYTGSERFLEADEEFSNVRISVYPIKSHPTSFHNKIIPVVELHNHFLPALTLSPKSPPYQA